MLGWDGEGGGVCGRDGGMEGRVEGDEDEGGGWGDECAGRCTWMMERRGCIVEIPSP